MIIATAGHIDHGKTTLVSVLTGVDTDRLPEEKSRGLTIDLGFAYQPLAEGAVLGFVDVPGHEKFIRNMLAGVTGIDFALLVIAADDGPMAQTREHLAILDLLGIEAGAVALTKTDLVDAARVRAVCDDIKALLDPTTLGGVPVFEVSGLTGDGVAALRDHLHDAAGHHHARSRRGHFRLAVDRCFTIAGAGLVVTGTAFSGEVRVGDKLLISPANIPVRVRAIHAQNQKSDTGAAGQRLGVNITGTGIGRDSVHRGDWLLAEPAHAPTRRLDVRARLLPDEARALRHWLPVHVHLGSAEVTGRVALLEGKNIPPGGDGLVQLVLDRDMVAVKGDKFVLRDTSAQRTLGGGVVIDPFGPKRGRAKPERLERLSLLETPDPAEAFSRVLEHSGAGLEVERFRLAWNLTDEEMTAILGSVDMIKAGADDDAVAYSPEVWSGFMGDTIRALDEGHERNPDKPGLEEEALRRYVRPRLTQPVFRSLLDA
ncbi:MAG: selenocysteine-specific translation elongation factor, partial [Rhodospirillales bacterium]|nr:selenocysteine-specific translation elongation factor [Rhodospirillales bacterium]